jgi:PhnB protein
MTLLGPVPCSHPCQSVFHLWLLLLGSGSIAHAEIQIGDSVLMLADEFPDMGFKGPQALGGTPVSMMIYVPDVDRVADQARAAGATELRPVQDQFYGDRSGTFVDPFGHMWTIATHIEDVPPDEMARRSEKAMAEMAGAGQN